MRGRTALVVVGIAGAVGSSLLLSASLFAAPKAAAVVVANMRIDADPAFHIRADTWTADSFGAFIDTPYRDYRVAGGDTCVQGEIYSTGLVSLVLNRRMPDGTKCSENGMPPRQFRIRFENVAACAELGLTATDGGTCEHLTPAGSPHVRGETVFKSRTGSTAMTFYFITQTGGTTLNQYRLTTDARAPIVGSTNVKTVTYTAGTATLARHEGNPGGYVPLVYDIPMSFRITFERVTVP